MSDLNLMLCNRRNWLASQTLGLLAFVPKVVVHPVEARAHRYQSRYRSACLARQMERLDPEPWQRLAQQAVEAAHEAGARYADARLTRFVRHEYGVAGGVISDVPKFSSAEEYIGVGVRALVDGYWGFSASTVPTPDEVVRLARDAVGQAKENAKGTPWTVDLGQIPVAKGSWATPVRIDPFSVPIEEKEDYILYWKQCAAEAGVSLYRNGFPSFLLFGRQERVVATSEGSLFTQTLYESGGVIQTATGPREEFRGRVNGIELTAAGWELFLDAKIPEQFSSGQLGQELARKAADRNKPATIGRYTVVCDGATMAALVEATLGIVTQLDRALGYEANGAGTSWFDDPLAMVGSVPATAPGVTLTANRSAPGELATVRWDDEGVVPEDFTLIKNGTLVDFQTTREQAAWLAPYYQRHGRPVRSHGCAATESAHFIPLQQMPNLSLEPNPSSIRLEDLVADVPDGILLTNSIVLEVDAQARTGLLFGHMQAIKNGRVGTALDSLGLLFNGPELWKAVKAVGGADTKAKLAYSPTWGSRITNREDVLKYGMHFKGQPSQQTSHTVTAVAATITNQPLIDVLRKA